MRLITFLITVVLSFDVLGQKNEADQAIPWTADYQLTWEDFQGKAKKSHFASAMSDITFTVDIKTEGQSLVIFIQPAFNKNSSWVKESDKNEKLLRHEQTHFDIYEVNARKFRKELQSKPLSSVNAQTTINRLMEKYTKLNHDSQEKYDEETEHSLREKNQEIWNKRIDEDLKELSGFADPNFRTTIDVK